MKFYRKQIDTAKRAEVQAQKEIQVQQKPRETTTLSPNQEARVRFMRNLVNQSRADL